MSRESSLKHPEPRDSLNCLFVCLLVCLFVYVYSNCEKKVEKKVLANNCLKSGNNEPLCKRDRVHNSRSQREEREEKREIDDFCDGRSSS